MHYFAAFKMRAIDTIPLARRTECDGYHCTGARACAGYL